MSTFLRMFQNIPCISFMSESEQINRHWCPKFFNKMHCYYLSQCCCYFNFKYMLEYVVKCWTRKCVGTYFGKEKMTIIYKLRFKLFNLSIKYFLYNIIHQMTKFIKRHFLIICEEIERIGVQYCQDYYTDYSYAVHMMQCQGA